MVTNEGIVVEGKPVGQATVIYDRAALTCALLYGARLYAQFAVIRNPHYGAKGKKGPPYIPTAQYHPDFDLDLDQYGGWGAVEKGCRDSDVRGYAAIKVFATELALFLEDTQGELPQEYSLSRPD